MTNENSKEALSYWLIAIVLIMVFAGGLGVYFITHSETPRAILMQDRVVIVFDKPKTLDSFTLKDHNGKPFDLARLKGQWTVLFFGYTSCPDVCPTTLVMLDAVQKKLVQNKGAAKAVQFVFVSVDPRRDTLAKLKPYTTHYNKSFTGVTGDDKEIKRLARGLGAAYEVLDDGSNHYPVNHTAALFVIDPQGRYFAVMTPPYAPGPIAERLELVVKLISLNP